MKKTITIPQNRQSFTLPAPFPLVAGDVNAYEVVLPLSEDAAGAQLTVQAKRANNQVVTDMVQINGTEARYTLKSNMYDIAGGLFLRLQVVQDGSILSECQLDCEVLEAYGSDMTADDRLPVLSSAIAQTQEAAAAANGAANAANEAAQAANEAAEEAAGVASRVAALEHNTTLIQNSGGGFAAGADAEADTGAALGRKAWTGDGGAAGYLAYAANGGGSAGKNANSNAGGAVGADAKAGAGFAGGKSAKAVDSSGGGIDAIQLGTGTNSVPKTVQAYGYQLMDANGKIPLERLPNTAQTVEELEVTTNDIFTADELNTFTCGMEEARTAIIKQHYIIETAAEGTAYGNAMFITVESDTATYNGHQDGHPILEQTLYCSPGLVYTRTGTNKNDGSMLYEWENWELEKNFVSDAPSDGTLYGRKDGGWEQLTSLHTHANKAVLDATEVAYTESDQARIGTLESDLDTFYTDLNNLQNTAVTDAPSDGNTYGRKNGAWEKLTNLASGQNSQLINFVPLQYNGSDVTDLDNLPNGITIVSYMDGPGAGGYMVMTALETVSGLGYQIKMSVSGMSYRFNNGGGSWAEWQKMG